MLGGVATLGFVWVGDPEAGREHARALETLGRPLGRRVVELSYLDLQRREDTIEGHALRRYWKGQYFHELPDAAIEALLAHDPSVAASLQAYGGAIAEVPDDETAFSQRETAFEYVGAARWTDPAEDATRISDRPGERGRAGAVRERRLRQRARGRRCGRRTSCLLPREADQAHRAEGRRRPRQRLPPQPEHPAESLKRRSLASQTFV